MKNVTGQVARLLAGAAVLGLLALIVYGTVVPEGSYTEFYLLFRWPVVALVGVFVPLLALRLVMWRRNRGGRGQGTAQSAP